MRPLVRSFRRDERGAVMVIAAAAMVAMLAMAAFAVDIGSWYQVKRQVQSAADAAALAGVQDLPGSPSAAQADAQTYVSKNIPGATATVTTPYQGSASQIQVSVTKTAPSMFGKLLGINSANVTASAAAKKSPMAATSAVFSNDTGCAGTITTINGTGIAISGGTHSNGGLIQNGTNNSLGPTSYGGPNGCSYTSNGTGDTYGGAPSPTVDSNLESWPVDFSVSPPACTYSASSFLWNGSNITIPSGVYCASGTITVNGSNIQGNVTFIGGTVLLNGTNLNLTPFASGLLIYQTGASTLTINGSAINGGTVFAPNATIIVNGSAGTTTGFVEGLDVVINGTNWTFTGNGPPLLWGTRGTLVQ